MNRIFTSLLSLFLFAVQSPCFGDTFLDQEVRNRVQVVIAEELSPITENSDISVSVAVDELELSSQGIRRFALSSSVQLQEAFFVAKLHKSIDFHHEHGLTGPKLSVEIRLDADIKQLIGPEFNTLGDLAVEYVELAQFDGKEILAAYEGAIEYSIEIKELSYDKQGDLEYLWLEERASLDLDALPETEFSGDELIIFEHVSLKISPHSASLLIEVHLNPSCDLIDSDMERELVAEGIGRLFAHRGSFRKNLPFDIQKQLKSEWTKTRSVLKRVRL